MLIYFASLFGRMGMTSLQAWSLITITMFLHTYGSAQEMNLNPTRPTIANSATMQSRGVMQVETGYDAYPRGVLGNQQTVDMFLTYTPLARLRLDFGWSAFNHQQDGDESTNGVACRHLQSKEA